MEKEQNLSNTENANIKSTLPSADALKYRFKEGSIPLQTDYADLIEIADMGRKACGLALEQQGAGTGLKLGEDGALNLKIGNLSNQNAAPLVLKEDVLSVELGDGLNGGNKGISVKAAQGIKVDSAGIGIDYNHVLPRGMIVMFSGDTAPDGWAFCDGGTYEGVTVPDLRNRFIMCGETVSEKGENGKARGEGNGKEFCIDTEAKRINIKVQETTLTTSQIPQHNHISGITFHSENEGMKYKFDHTKVEKYGAKKPPSVFALKNETWEVKEPKIVEHRIGFGYRSFYQTNAYNPYTSETGEGKGHKHEIETSSTEHTHSVNVIPPYYLLAFIMKL
ncbi:hypothetical protein Xmau_00917 [Xenorhabdus mauleonii]|uniref:Phage Tail Collar Domain n=1 Tax=Xenorhabdus mauleonii TaxID=351675 RepID=A0A1I3LQN9_9GAMM|nr:tail fiber protein [Xenorhabdus mauleonii]PHM45267.1 hypothetical protein Xmau_00917 [Xenorhabdus mauleonii]SFI86860.1 Phage Tail Collar Domain [Xenorhabdus mauleonii]